MELGVKKMTKRTRQLPTISGFLSFLIGLIALAGLNGGLILETEAMPEFFIIRLPFLGLILGVIGLFTRKRSKLYAIWGISICIFIYIFIFLMFGLAWSINPKP
jgi:hypothetical protein